MDRDPPWNERDDLGMNTNLAVVADLAIDPEFEAAVNEWSPRDGLRPAVEMERRPDGLRVKMTYLGVESGVLFAWGARVKRRAVQGTLDRVFDVLSWRVISPPAMTRGM
jgi:hypothetical protein